MNIKTVASGVKTDLSGDSYVIANGKNQFEYVSLELKNKDDAMNINKGNKLDLICVVTKNNVMFPILKNCVTADSYFHKHVEMIMDKINNLKRDDRPSNCFEAFYLDFWEVDTKNPNVLDKYKTVEELLKDNTGYGEVLKIAESKEIEETKALVMPKP